MRWKMKNLIGFKTLTAILVIFLVFGAGESFAQVKKKPVLRKKTTVKRAVVQKPAMKYYTVPTGEVFRVRMNETITSKTANVGDTFTTTTTQPVYSNTGVIVIPNGSTITGRIDSVKRAKKGGDPGTIGVSFIEVKLPNTTKRAMNGSLTSLDTKKAKSDDEGNASGDDRKNDKLIFIGGGAAGGALIGAAIGGGKGALIGGILGGVGGLLGERLTKGEEAEVKSGTEFGIYLNRAITLPKFTSTDENYSEYDNEPTTGGRTYVVQYGDTLSKISMRFYGNTGDWMKIYDANRNTLSRPEDLQVGQELIIP